MPTKKNANSPAGAFNPGAWISLVTESQSGIAAICEYARVSQEQRTERARITAETAVHLARVQTVRDVVMDYLDRSFDERRTVFQELFVRIDCAVESGDAETALAALNTLAEVSKQSPFKAIADVATLQRTLLEKKTDWRF